MRRPVLALLALGALLALVAGCSKHIGALRPPVPPDTRLFVQGPVDTVNHVVHLYWFGTDPDGYIRGFEYRFFTSPEDSAHTPWTFTRATNLVLDFPDSTGFTSPTFEVRAVDSTMVAPPPDAAPGAPGGLRDPTPARENFTFSNHPPVVKLVLGSIAPKDTTFASVTVSWTVTDPDNDLASARFRIWLDGHQNDPDIVTGRSFTVPTARFTEADGRTIVSRPRQLFIQAIDDGGMTGNVDSTRWIVRAPATGSRHGRYGRLLIIDDLSNQVTAARHRAIDAMYMNTAADNLPAGTWSILRMYNFPSAVPFRSSKDVEQTFKMFDAVVWYVGGLGIFGNFDAFETYLQNYQDGVGAYLDSGGNFEIDGSNLLDAYNAPGALTQDFARRYLGITGYVQRWEGSGILQTPDSTAAWGASGSTSDPVVFPTLGDSLILGPTNVNDPKHEEPTLRGAIVEDASYGFAVGPPAALTNDPPFPLVVGVCKPGANEGVLVSGGRAIVLTFPLGYTNPPPMDPRTPGVLLKILQLFGVTGP